MLLSANLNIEFLFLVCLCQSLKKTPSTNVTKMDNLKYYYCTGIYVKGKKTYQHQLRLSPQVCGRT